MAKRKRRRGRRKIYDYQNIIGHMREKKIYGDINTKPKLASAAIKPNKLAPIMKSSRTGWMRWRVRFPGCGYTFFRLDFTFFYLKIIKSKLQAISSFVGLSNCLLWWGKTVECENPHRSAQKVSAKILAKVIEWKDSGFFLQVTMTIFLKKKSCKRTRKKNERKSLPNDVIFPLDKAKPFPKKTWKSLRLAFLSRIVLCFQKLKLFVLVAKGANSWIIVEKIPAF